MSRERSRSVFKQSYDRKSPCVPPNKREQPRIKSSPSPVVLCVPRAPHLPPPSLFGVSRKFRGFPTVRSGSSSPRHWGAKGWFHDCVNFEEACLPMNGSEVVWPSWRKKSVSACQLTQPLAGASLQDWLIAISQLRTYIAFPVQPPEQQNCSTCKASMSLFHTNLHDEINSFCKQHAARYLTDQEWVKSDSLKILENTAIPIIMLVVEVPHDLVSSAMSNVPMPKEAHQGTGEQGNRFQADSASCEISTSPKWSNLVKDNKNGVKLVRLDVSVKSPSHTRLQTTGLVIIYGKVLF